MLDALESHPGAVAAVRRAIAGIDGVAAVYVRNEILSRQFGDDDLGRKVANGYLPARSGDIVVVGKPYWLINTNDTANHGTPYRYDTHVPIVRMGAGIKSGEYLEPVTPLDIAPTLAHLAGITLPFTQGHLLTPALSTPQGSRALDTARSGSTAERRSTRTARQPAREAAVPAVLSKSR